MTTPNYTPLSTTSTVLVNIKAYHLSLPNPGYTFEAYVARINQSPDLVNALNNYTGKIEIDANPSANTHIYRLDNQNRDLLLNSTALLSPTFLTRSLAHEVYGHDQTRSVILSVLDPSNPLYAGKSPEAVAELVKTGCFMTEALGFIGEYRIGKQAGFSPTGYPGLEADIASALSRVSPLFPPGTDQRIIDLAAAQSLATKVQLSDRGHAQQCTDWANSVINSTPNAAPVARMISEYNPTTGESSTTVTTPTLKITDRLLADGSHSDDAQTYDALGRLVSRTTTTINAASTQTTTSLDSNADNIIDKTTTKVDADRNGIAERTTVAVTGGDTSVALDANQNGSAESVTTTHANQEKDLLQTDEAALAWATISTHYDALGRADYQRVSNDNASYTLNDWDQAGANATALAATNYDTLGRLDTMRVTKDDESITTTDWTHLAANQADMQIRA
jgi:YD repeat-containing protein